MRSMRPPFPGMDPWLEHPALWPDVHNRLIAAIGDALSPLVAPNYYVALERRTYRLKPDDIAFIGRPDLAVAARADPQVASAAQPRATGVLEVEVPMSDEVGEDFLEIHEVDTRKLVCVLELLSPVNKLHAQGREDYETKRAEIFRSRTSLVEVDLLRDGRPMPVVGQRPGGNYSILVSRGHRRPRAQLFCFSVRDPIPSISVPLAPGDDEPELDLGAVLHALYDRARFDLRLDYAREPVPPLSVEDGEWARGLASRPS